MTEPTAPQPSDRARELVRDATTEAIHDTGYAAERALLAYIAVLQTELGQLRHITDPHNHPDPMYRD